MSTAMAGGRGWMTIGEVLSQLSREFPDVSISKIRFLEGEGLVTPDRAKSGYRRFTDDDVEQLRLVLVAQRDHYLPLKVIKEHLAAGTLAEMLNPQGVPEGPPVEFSSLQAAPPPEVPEPDIDPGRLFHRSEAIGRGGVSEEDVAALVDSGVIAPDPTGRFSGADILLLRSYAVLRTFGVDQRHMRQARNAASRESYLIGNAVGHLTGPERADATTRMLGALSDAHYWLVVAELHRQHPASAPRSSR